MSDIRLKFVSEKGRNNTGDTILFFAVNQHKDNDELFEIMEELDKNTEDLILPFFRGENDFIVKINKKWILPSDNPLELKSNYRLNIVFKKI